MKQIDRNIYFFVLEKESEKRENNEITTDEYINWKLN